MKHLLVSLLTLCCFSIGVAFAGEPLEGNVYVSKEYRFGMEKGKKDCSLQIVRQGAEYQMMIYAPKGKAMQVIRTNDSDGNLNYMTCVDRKSVEKDGVACDLLVFQLPVAYDEEEYRWTDMQVDGYQVPVSVARKMRLQMQKGFHMVNMKYNYDRSKLPSKIRYEQGWMTGFGSTGAAPGMIGWGY